MINLSGFMKSFYEVGNWIAKMMFLHLLWIAFTILGLGVFGIMPATLALVSVIHKRFESGFDLPIFKTFISVYKKQFLKANGLGLLWLGIGIFLFQDIRISQQVIQSFYLHAFLILVTFLYMVTSLYFFTVYARYDLKFFYYFKQAFLIALSRPFETIAMFICLVLFYYFFGFLPILLFFMGSSLIMYPLVWFAFRACHCVEEKKVMLASTTAKGPASH